MKKTSIIPDSSFFICFLDDIEKPELIQELLKNDKFDFFLGRITFDEIKKSKNFQKIANESEQKIIIYDYFEYGEVVRIFFSESEIRKGEHEVFVISFIFTFLNNPFIAILDDEPAKKFFKNNIPEKASSVMGTIGFIKICSCECKIFIKATAINILELIKKSKFFVSNKIIEVAIEQIRAC